MDTRDLFPHEILQDAIGKSCAKSEFSIKMLVILSFLGGGYVGFGYLACLRVISGIPAEWNGLAALLGASVFPIALICILIGGGELATGNMMIMALGRLTGRVSTYKLVRNWLIVSLGNLAGAVAMAYFLGHYVGLAEGPAAAKTIAIAEAKVNMDFGRAFVSAIACNWMVCMGIWFYFGARHTSGRILAMWFPVMIFVLIGFQHFVHHSGRHLGGRKRQLGSIFLQYDSRFLRQRPGRVILCRSLLSLCLQTLTKRRFFYLM